MIMISNIVVLRKPVFSVRPLILVMATFSPLKSSFFFFFFLIGKKSPVLIFSYYVAIDLNSQMHLNHTFCLEATSM